MAGVMAALSLKFGDLGAKYVERKWDFPALRSSVFAASTIPLDLILDKVYDKIPGINKVKVDTETLKKTGHFWRTANNRFYPRHYPCGCGRV